MTESYKVKVGQFEGPLDLLLDLIEKRRLHINDLSLAEVTDGYVDHIGNLSNFPTEDAANFITIASTLILIKSISLLPSLTISAEESENIEELQERLKILQDVREKSLFIKRIFGKDIIFMAPDRRDIQVVFSPTGEITIENFLRSIKDIILSMPPKELLPKAVVKKILSLEEAIDNLLVRVEKDLKTSFQRVNHGRVSKVNIIINFLAVLELVKRGIILVRQDRHFCDIDIESGENKVPIYT